MMSDFDFEFKRFPSIKRMRRGCVVTEKIDGTNAQLVFDEYGSMICGSRNRVISSEDDNYGFARWAESHQESLFQILGEGRHYGEWWGSGIQRGYGDNERTFSLFNTGRWNSRDLDDVDQLDVVPVLYAGEFTTEKIEEVLDVLGIIGSVASDGFRKPEGIVIYHTQIQQMFKLTFDHDKTGKLEV